MVKVDANTGEVEFIFEGYSEPTVYLVGDFNNWNETSHPMKRQGDVWSIKLKLSPGEYQYRYLSGGAWLNDRSAHRYQANPFGSENSVVSVLESSRSPKAKAKSVPQSIPQAEQHPDMEIPAAKGRGKKKAVTL